ncbi:hypothetical protein PISMIDRAFT_688359, partial [Pisolithus microcarpus 441]
VVQYLLNSTDTNNYEPGSMIDYALKTQVQLRHMLTPYVGLNVVPRLNGADVKEKASDVLDWDRCGPGVLPGVDQFIGTDREPGVETTQKMMNAWRKDVDELMACLDWNVWVKCRPECDPKVFLPNDALEYPNYPIDTRKCVISRPGQSVFPYPMIELVFQGPMKVVCHPCLRSQYWIRH